MLKEGNLLLQVEALNVDHMHLTARPLVPDISLQLLDIDDVASDAVRPIHYGHCQRGLLHLHPHRSMSI